MYLLAQVQWQSNQQPVAFRVLARQQTGSVWIPVETPENITCDGANLPHLRNAPHPDQEPLLHESQLVLIQMNELGEVTSLTDAVPFILNLIRTYLSTGSTEARIQQETDRVEAWRQQLALKSQELSRQLVEVETRKVQIEQLAASLQRDRQELEGQRQEVAARLQALKGGEEVKGREEGREEGGEEGGEGLRSQPFSESFSDTRTFSEPFSDTST